MCKEPESQPEPGEGNSIFLLLKRKWWPWQPYTLSFINNINRQMADWEKIYEMLKTDSEKNSDLEYAKNPWNLIRKDMKLHKKKRTECEEEIHRRGSSNNELESEGSSSLWSEQHRPLQTHQNVKIRKLYAPFYFPNVPPKKGDKLYCHPTSASPLLNTCPRGIFTNGLCIRMSF